MRQYALAAMNYHDVYKKFPFNAAANQNEDLSWRVRVLPFVEEMALYDQLDIKQGPTAEVNAAFANKMPKIFGEDGKLANVVWVQSKVNRFADVVDGTVNTIMMVEYKAGTPWMEKDNVTQAEALKLIKNLPDGESLNVVFYDGSVRTMTNSVDEETLRRLLDPRDGQVVNF